MDTGLHILELLAGYIACGLVGLFGLLTLYRVYTNEKSGLELLISEKDGTGASMSRFQLLIFTFVISLSFFLIVASNQEFPEVPGGVLALLGISATSYTVSKAIQPSVGKPS